MFHIDLDICWVWAWWRSQEAAWCLRRWAQSGATRACPGGGGARRIRTTSGGFRWIMRHNVSPIWDDIGLLKVYRHNMSSSVSGGQFPIIYYIAWHEKIGLVFAFIMLFIDRSIPKIYICIFYSNSTVFVIFFPYILKVYFKKHSFHSHKSLESIVAKF